MALSRHPTLFRFCSLPCTLASAGFLIVFLLVMAEPGAAQGLGPANRFLYWSLHVGTAIGALFVASQLLRSFNTGSVSTTNAILLAGLAGTALVTPVYLLIEQFWPTAGSTDVDDWLDLLQQNGLLGSATAEYIEALPWTMPFWLLINLPLIFMRTQSGGGRVDQCESIPESPDQHEAARTTDTPDSAPVAPVARSIPAALPQQPADKPATLKAMPAVFGKEIIAISSDMHYLVVSTTLGNTTIHGKLKDAIDELGAQGMQVHRSHWIAHKHVARVINAEGRLTCVMSNGARIPVSRRRGKTVREYYGIGVIKHDLH